MQSSVLEATRGWTHNTGSIGFPNAGCREFYRMTIRVSEIEARSATIPRHFAFDLDAVLGKMVSPRIKVLSGDGKREVCRAFPVVRRNPTSRANENPPVVAPRRNSRSTVPLPASRPTSRSPLDMVLRPITPS